jgi:hypothetical protein
MKDKYLCKDGITEKYENRFFLINSLKYAGTLGGGTFALINIGRNNSAEEVLISGGVSVLSYLFGNYLYKKSEIKKEKALKNVEARILREGRI